ncbi:Fic family protein [Actinoplanes sp. TBRC 11911]|uniref:Fic family protein n=1 Tax=Actinoplanes sp. TBRC 11911 TaxID=2729386 RepID=UPI00145E805B|nr:Fic family protein [Actinoplanes sp. TBRC 11911]NMO51965.1 Fic family protein [Actinoplanes sp. TBRC 11911]
MAELREAHWDVSWDAPARRDKWGGRYDTYIPDTLLTRPLVVSPDVAHMAARVETAVRGLADTPGAMGLESLARFLLRSEAIASSRIEGLQVSAQQVALAELATTEDAPIASFNENARLVANNIVTLRQAAGVLAACETISPQSFCDLHRALLPQHPQQGIRDAQNWIGGSDWHPLGADFVPPPPSDVPSLVEDLAEYLSGAVHAPLIQAALVHAQFETIHPFADGNGRVGRALIHTVLTRRGLTKAAILPVSLVLLTRSEEYVAGLTAYRYLGRVDGPEATAGVDTWLETFLLAVGVAVEQARHFVTMLAELQKQWAERYLAFRYENGAVRQPRSQSAVMRLLPLLPEAPVTTPYSAQRLLGVSGPAARAALEELADAHILSRKKVDRGTTAYLARDVFDLLTITERRLASTRWDTRESAPNRPIPARPQG